MFIQNCGNLANAAEAMTLLNDRLESWESPPALIDK
jgi:hypothetical protein